MASVAVLIKEGGELMYVGWLLSAASLRSFLSVHTSSRTASSVTRVTRKPTVSVRANCAVQLGGERDSFLASESRGR